MGWAAPGRLGWSSDQAGLDRQRKSHRDVTASCCLGSVVWGTLPRGPQGAALCWASAVFRIFRSLQCSWLQGRGKPCVKGFFHLPEHGAKQPQDHTLLHACTATGVLTTHLKSHPHTQRLFRAGSGHDFTSDGLWDKGYGMDGGFMGLLGSTKVPAPAAGMGKTPSKVRCPSPPDPNP